MKPVDQEHLHRPEEGSFGDCMRATVATLLDLPREEVPHFLYDGTTDGLAFHCRVNDFLRPMNLAYLPVSHLSEVLEVWGIRGLHHEVSGPTERGTCHACAAIDGEVKHDPHPTRAGLTKIEAFGVFVVLDPSKPISLRKERTE